MATDKAGDYNDELIRQAINLLAVAGASKEMIDALSKFLQPNADFIKMFFYANFMI